MSYVGWGGGGWIWIDNLELGGNASGSRVRPVRLWAASPRPADADWPGSGRIFRGLVQFPNAGRLTHPLPWPPFPNIGQHPPFQSWGTDFSRGVVISYRSRRQSCPRDQETRRKAIPISAVIHRCTRRHLRSCVGSVMSFIRGFTDVRTLLRKTSRPVICIRRRGWRGAQTTSRGQVIIIAQSVASPSTNNACGERRGWHTCHNLSVHDTNQFYATTTISHTVCAPMHKLAQCPALGR